MKWQNLRAAGFDQLPAETLVRTRDHGVNPDFIHRVKSRGTAPTVDELIYMRDRGSY